MGLRLTDAIAVVAVATLVGTVVYGMWTGKGITFDSGYGKVVISGDDNVAIGKPAEPGKARADTQGTVWEAICPEQTRAISGSCIVGENGGNGLLRNVGIDRAHNSWHCVYSEPMTDVFVDAVCVDVD
jgi:hypothetical protein